MNTILRCKVALLGDEKVGKTSLLNQFKEREFKVDYDMTFGCSFVQHKVSITKKVKNKLEFTMDETVDKTYDVEFFFFDIGGNTIYHKEAKKYLENLNYFVLVYDVTNPESFNNLKKKWIDLVRKKDIPAKNQTPGFLIGTKGDIEDKKHITFLLPKQFATQNDLQFFEISSKKNNEVHEAFQKIANDHIAKYESSIDFMQYVGENNE